MKWHPAMIRWALYLHYKSSGCHKTLRNSGVIHLPSERTLCDCRHFAPSKPGFSPFTDLQLLEVVKKQQPESLSKYVTIVLDQIYIEERLQVVWCSYWLCRSWRSYKPVRWSRGSGYPRQEPLTSTSQVYASIHDKGAIYQLGVSLYAVPSSQHNRNQYISTTVENCGTTN